MSKGSLRIYLGAAPGVGKTFAMLNEGWRRKERGTDVVVGYVETHNRPSTAEQVRDLEVTPRRHLEYRGTSFTEMDLDALLERRPEVALVDELAHTNVPGCRNEKRWEDVEELLEAGINVISTVNIQHLESLNDVMVQITGVEQRETIPDHVVRAAEQVELVDMTPEALRRRMAHGNIYKAEKIDAALANYFRAGNLGALRELALLWLADKVDDALEEYRERHGIAQPWETRERVVVALTGAPGSEKLIRRAARIAQRSHGELMGVHVQTDDGLAGMPDEQLDEHRKLLLELDGEFREVTGVDVAKALVDFALAENATQVVLGASNRSRWQELTKGSIINRVIKLSPVIDVHVISQDVPEEDRSLRLPRPHPRRLAALPARRQAAGFLVAAVLLPVVTVVFAQLRGTFGLPSVLLIYLLAVVVVGTVGGALPAMSAALAGFTLANYYFTPPFYTFTIAETDNLLALAAFLLTTGVVSYLVDLSARRRAELLRARAEAEAMARMAGSLTDEELLPQLVDQLRSTFGVPCAAVFRRGENGTWELEAAAGDPIPREPGTADIAEPLGVERMLALTGGSLSGADHRLLDAVVAQAALALEARRLQGQAEQAAALARANDLRTGLLQAVSHDLRTPLASIKASITSLRQKDVQWSPDEEADFEETIEDETDRLTALVNNLLDMSRLQAGVLAPLCTETSLEEVVPGALAGLGPRARNVRLELPEDLPPVAADASLLERVVANLVDNALTWSPADEPPRVEAGAVPGEVLVRVVDRGPGIPRNQRDDVFQPFQRVVDHGSGVGLGLAIARGFTEAMGGELAIEDTPGGGTTMVVALPRFERRLVEVNA
jgi:two-component system sensor histidine kinase KdpD